MILREATIKYAGYDPDELTPKSAKRVCCICDGCGRVRWMGKAWYSDLCNLCACNTDEFRNAVRERQLGRKASKETCEKMSKSQTKRYEDPEERRKTGEATSRGMSKLLEDPEYTKQLGEAISERTIERYKDPEMREKARLGALKRYEDPLEHIKTSAAQQGISIEEWEDFAYNKPNHYGVSGDDYNEWRHAIYKRDFHTCQICGSHHCMIHAHHIKKQFLYPELILDINNGITMCKTCHELTYGKEELFVEELQMMVDKTI